MHAQAPFPLCSPQRPRLRRGRSAATLLSLCLGIASGCGPGVPSAELGREGSSILLVSLDTTRADRLGSYGRAQAGTPNLDALAARGVRFERAYATAPITLPSHASLLTGSYPPYHGIRDNGLFVLGEHVETLAETCAHAGYRTGAFVSAFPLLSMFGLDQGFEVYDDEFESPSSSAHGNMIERQAEVTVEQAKRWLMALEDGERFFAWVHLFDPHAPMLAPHRFGMRFPSDPYQAEISYADFAIGELFATLEQLGRTETTLVTVTADHGESLGEHGEKTHALLIYDSTMHVPLIMAGPGIDARVLSDPVSLVDVPATLVELARIADGGVFSRHGGRSLARAMLNLEPLGEREIYLESHYPRLHHGWSELEGIMHGEWKLVQAPGALLEDGAPRAELYRPAQDPAEANDLAAQEPERLAQLTSRLDALSQRLAEGAQHEARRELASGELDSLAALGYGGLEGAGEADEENPQGTAGLDPRLMMEASTHFNKVNAYAQDGLISLAEKSLAALAAIDQEGISYYEAEGNLQLARGRAGLEGAYLRAEQALAKACAMAPKRRGLWKRHAQALEGLGRLEEALKSLDEALRLAPPTEELLEFQRELTAQWKAQGE